MLFNELPIAFPWYEKKEQQNRYNENVDKVCDYKLISPRDALLRFQLTRPAGGQYPTLWEIYEVNSEELVATVSSSIPGLRVRLLEGKEYYTYTGEQLTTDSGTLLLPPGYYYSRIYWADNIYRYSEMFFVPDDGVFNIADDDDINFLRIEWWNDNDVRPVFFGEKQDDGKPYFRNVVYLDTFITASEPEIIEEGTRDGNDELVPTFQKAIVAYRISLVVPDFLKKALVIMQMHDHIHITTIKNVRSGEISRLITESTLEAGGALSNVELLFNETLLLKKGCGENMASDCTGSAPGINDIEISGANFVITGIATPGASVQVFKATTPGAVPVLASTNQYTSTQFSAGITLAQSLFTGFDYILVRATSFGCDFGFSTAMEKP
jgi:hypothetical protein